jgi:hypothetical protein
VLGKGRQGGKKHHQDQSGEFPIHRVPGVVHSQANLVV